MKRVVLLLLAAGLLFVAAAPAVAEPPSSDPSLAAKDAAAWLAAQVNDQGFIPSAFTPGAPDLSLSAQAVSALAAADVGREQVDALLAYLGRHVDDFVVRDGADSPAALAYLILAAVPGGANPTSFGTPATNLVARLQATQQPSGLFGVSDPTFDGAYRQGLALLALDAVGLQNTTGTAWLTQQQCANGLWTAFRADVGVACPAVDPVMFTGPDTNSTALAVLALQVHGLTAQASVGVDALDEVRNDSGGWGYLAQSDQATDANSTGLVLMALRAALGTRDSAGTAALLGLQVGCGADPSDRGGIAFQSAAGGALAPDALATAQAIPALAGFEWPPHTPASIDTGVAEPCAAASGGATTSTVTTTTPTTPTTLVATAASPPASDPSGELPRTGSSSAALLTAAVVMLAVGAAAVAWTRRSRAAA